MDISIVQISFLSHIVGHYLHCAILSFFYPFFAFCVIFFNNYYSGVRRHLPPLNLELNHFFLRLF